MNVQFEVLSRCPVRGATILSGRLQIPQQNLTVSHQFNLCHKLTRKYYKKSHAFRFTAHHMAIFRAISQACCYITIVSISGPCPVSDSTWDTLCPTPNPSMKLTNSQQVRKRDSIPRTELEVKLV